MSSKSKSDKTCSQKPRDILPSTKLLTDPYFPENNVRFDKYEFKHVATWETPIKHKEWWETVRVIFGEILTLGIGAFWRRDHLNFDHEAFVAWGKDPSGRGIDIFFIAQYGDGVIIPKLKIRRGTVGKYFKSKKKQMDPGSEVGEALNQEGNVENNKEPTFKGFATPNIRDAVLHMACSDNLKTWVKLPSGGEKKYVYVYKDGKESEPSDLAWKSLENKLTLQKLSEMIFETDCTGKRYCRTTNNCHHFAKNLYKMCK